MTKFLEKTILNKVDELIQLIIELSSQENNYSILKEKAIEKTLEIIPLILHFLDGNLTHIEPMLYQLIKEKLPNTTIISSFGKFQEELNILLKEVMVIFLKNPQYYLDYAEKITEKNEVKNILDEDCFLNSDLQNNLQTSVFKAFPSEKIIFNYPIRGQNLDVYLPQLNLALISTKNNKSFIKLEYLCKKQRIHLLQVPEEIENDPRRLIRFIKRTAR